MPVSAVGPPKNSARIGDVAGRIARLTLKELREILRDRRTIITLVLMPALVYPILSVVFQKFMLTSFRLPTESEVFAVGLEPSSALGNVTALMRYGGDVLRRSQDDSEGSENSAAGPSIKYFEGENLEARVADLQLDLGLRVRIDDDRKLANGESQLHVQLLYREGSITSEDALRYFESRLNAANTDYLKSVLRQVEIPSVSPTSVSVQSLKSTASTRHVAGHLGAADPDLDDDDRRGLSGHRSDRRRARTRHARGPGCGAHSAPGPAAGQIRGGAHRRLAHRRGEPDIDDHHAIRRRFGVPAVRRWRIVRHRHFAGVCSAGVVRRVLFGRAAGGDQLRAASKKRRRT